MQPDQTATGFLQTPKHHSGVVFEFTEHDFGAAGSYEMLLHSPPSGLHTRKLHLGKHDGRASFPADSIKTNLRLQETKSRQVRGETTFCENVDFTNLHKPWHKPRQASGETTKSQFCMIANLHKPRHKP